MKHASGFSMVEMMITVSILGVVGAGVGSMMSGAFKSSRTLQATRGLDDLTRKIKMTIEEPGHLNMTIAKNGSILGTINATTGAYSGCIADASNCAGINTPIEIFERHAGTNFSGTGSRLTGTPTSPVYYSIEGQKCEGTCAPSMYPLIALSRVRGDGTGVRFYFCLLARPTPAARKSIPQAWLGVSETKAITESTACREIITEHALSVGPGDTQYAYVRPLTTAFDPTARSIVLSSRVSCPVGQTLRGFLMSGAPDCAASYTPTPLPPTPTPTPISLPGGACGAGSAVVSVNSAGAATCGPIVVSPALINAALTPALLSSALQSVVPACGGASALSYNGAGFTCQMVRPMRCQIVQTLPAVSGPLVTTYTNIQCPAGSYPLGCWSQVSPCGLDPCNSNGSRLDGNGCSSWVRRKDHGPTTNITGVTCMPWDFSSPPAPVSSTAGATCSYW